MDRVSRDVKWNVSGVATVAVAVLLTQILAHGPWVEVALILGGGVVLGGVLAVPAYWAAQRRDPGEQFLREQASARAAQVALSPSRLALPGRVREEGA